MSKVLTKFHSKTHTKGSIGIKRSGKLPEIDQEKCIQDHKSE